MQGVRTRAMIVLQRSEASLTSVPDRTFVIKIITASFRVIRLTSESNVTFPARFQSRNLSSITLPFRNYPIHSLRYLTFISVILQAFCRIIDDSVKEIQSLKALVEDGACIPQFGQKSDEICNSVRFLHLFVITIIMVFFVVIVT